MPSIEQEQCAKNRGNTLPLYTYSILHFTFRYPVAISRGREDGRILEQKNFLVVDSSQLRYPSIKYVMLSIQWNYIALIVYNDNLDFS